MTKKTYDLDSYQKTCTSKVCSCNPGKRNGMEGFAVELEETCFFPEGGGQPSDRGVLNGIPVLDVYEEHGNIFHLLAKPIDNGETVQGSIDFKRRFHYMQIHSGEHMLSGIILKEQGLHNVGFHIGKDVNTIDLDGELSTENWENIEKQVNKMITQKLPVKVYYPDKNTLEILDLRKKPEVSYLRVIEIPGVDACGCCGTHVANTGEIGLLKIIDIQRYKGGTRLTFLCGDAAFDDYILKHSLVKEMATSFSCKPHEVGESVEHLLEEITELKISLAKKNRRLFSLIENELMQSAQLLGEAQWLFLAEEDFTGDEVKAFALNASKRAGILCTAFSCKEGCTRYAFSKGADCNISLGDLGKEFNQHFCGKGGGSKELFCGKLEEIYSVEELKSAIKNAIRV